ncbi:MAG: tetratricopeptide repeat protein [Candidatus Acidiferrales bacterium]
MQIPLDSANQRRALLAASLAIAALLTFQASRIWLADHRLHSDRLEVMERGAALEPDNAAAWDNLGHRRQFDLANPDPAGALADYQRAVERDPLSAHYWMDLAGALEEAGNIPQAREAFERARKVYPESAEVAWNYGNFLLRQEDFSEGFAEIQRAAGIDPTLLPLAISRTWRSNRDVNLLLDRVLPANAGAYFQALDFFASNHQAAACLAVWQRLLALGISLQLQRSFPFLDELIREDRAEDAGRVWREALTAAGVPHDEPMHNSLVWNGDFAREFLNGGLDWRWVAPPGVAIDFDAAPPAHGAHSVRLDFGGGSNIELTEPLQFIPVEPGRTYDFHAYMRTEGITTESGIRFSLTDPNHSDGAHLVTENFMGSHVWTDVDGDITTSAETHFLLLRLFRIPSRMFDNKLSGTVWIADVSLVPASAEPGKPAR